MVMKKSSEVRHVIMHWVTIPIAHVHIAVEGIFLPHEGVRVLPYLVANTRIVLKEGLQSRMVLHEHSIVQQRRVSANLFGNFTMAIEKLVEARYVSAAGISILSIVSAVGIAILSIAILSIAILSILSASITVLFLRADIANLSL